MNCPACNEKIITSPINNHNGYSLYHCYVCDLVFWYPMKSPGPGFYQEALVLTSARPVWLAHWGQKQFLKDMPAENGRLLDIGCGLGDFLYKANEAGYNVSGIDFTPNCVEIVRRRFGFADIYSLTLQDFSVMKPENSYDVITFFEVLEHLDVLTDFLSLVKKLLKPGGYIACSVPNRDKWRFSSIIEECDYPPNHFTHWNPRSLTWLLENDDFSVLSIRIQPLLTLDHGWFYLIASKLGLQRLGSAVASRLQSKRTDGDSRPPASDAVTLTDRLIKLGMTTYVRIIFPFLGALTFPLWVLFRRQGSVIYLLARLKETTQPYTSDSGGEF